jgi:EAL domain-containing protein (putative c-di-GMP-specific phosphodiesterase class I)/FixJ family two-component response regulator
VNSGPYVSRRLLVVDDERIQRLIIARAVGNLGFVADAAASLDDALACLGDRAYDVVILDLSLGETDGISLLQALRDCGCDPVVIFISRLDDRIRIASMRLATAFGLRVAGSLHKPVAPAALRDMLLQTPPRPAAAPDRAVNVPTVEELTRAMHNNAIVTQFQPKVSLNDGAVVGMESLARWPRGGSAPVPPDVFIPLAERSGVIATLTFSVMRQALIACSQWRKTHPACSVAVNISPLVLTDPTLPDEIDRMLHETGLSPGALVAEITESTVIANPLAAAQILTRLRIKGISLSIDDFGTGHSSLLSLLRMPFSELKIDQSFTSQCETDPEAWKIVRATVSMARELGLSVVAEGIETNSVAERLRDIGCQTGQGWLFGRPMSEATLLAWLNEREPVTV